MVNPADVSDKGTIKDYAKQESEKWKKGLAEWNQDGARIKRLRESADFVIYTPGSNSGIPVSILKSFEVPPKEIMQDNEVLREKISSTVTSLLSLIGIDAIRLKVGSTSSYLQSLNIHGRMERILTFLL